MTWRLVKSHLSILGLGLALTACNATPPGAGESPVGEESLAELAPGPCPSPAPLHLASRDRLPGAYIVVFKDGVTDSVARTQALEERLGFSATYRYSSALKGFAARLPEEMVAALRCEPDVAYIEEDAEVHVN